MRARRVRVQAGARGVEPVVEARPRQQALVDAAQAQAEAAQNIQSRMQQAQEMIGILPHVMRGQRVIELAQARNCDWLAGAMPR